MRIFILLLSIFILLLSLFALPAYAVDYYACACDSGLEIAPDGDCVAGNDGNNGTSQATPWLTIDKVATEFTNLNPGDRILMCNGGAFSTTSKRLNNFDSTGSNRVTLGAYQPTWGSGNEYVPYLEFSGSSGGFNLEDPDDAHEEGYIFENFHMRCPLCTTSSGNGWQVRAGLWYVTWDNVVVDGFRNNINIGCFRQPPAWETEGDGYVRFLEIKNGEITRARRQGMFGCLKDSTVENMYIHRNGRKNQLDHGAYFSSVERSEFKNSELYLNANGGANDNCKGTQHEAHGIIEDYLIEGNFVHNPQGAADSQCWGLNVSYGYSYVEEFKDVVMRNNLVINTGLKGISWSSCSEGCVMENNIVIQDHVPNFSAGQKMIDAVTKRSSQSVGPDAEVNAVTLKNNTLVMTANAADNTAATGSTGIEINEEGTNHLVANNNIIFTNPDSRHVCMSFSGNSPTGDFLKVDENRCNNTLGSWTDTAATLANWRSNTQHGDGSSEGPTVFNDIISGGSQQSPNPGSGPNSWVIDMDLGHSDPNLIDQGSNDANVGGSGRAAFASVDYNGLSNTSPNIPPIGALRAAGSPPTNTPPTNVNAGPNQTIEQPVDTIAVSGSATDDGLIQPLTHEWQCISPGAAPDCGGNVSIQNSNLQSTNITSTVVNNYTIEYCVDDGEFTVCDTMVFTVDPDPFPPLAACPEGRAGSVYRMEGSSNVHVFCPNQ